MPIYDSRGILFVLHHPLVRSLTASTRAVAELTAIVSEAPPPPPPLDFLTPVNLGVTHTHAHTEGERNRDIDTMDRRTLFNMHTYTTEADGSHVCLFFKALYFIGTGCRDSCVNCLMWTCGTIHASAPSFPLCPLPARRPPLPRPLLKQQWFVFFSSRCCCVG